MTMTLRCARHGIRMTIDDEHLTRTWIAPPAGSGRGHTLCALLLAADPQPGRLHISDPDTGRPTQLYCDVEEES